MTDALSLVLAPFTGVSLGAIFFGGLWWTVNRGVSSRQPALWFLGSLMVRTAIVLAGFYFVARGPWQGLLLCLLGFVVARPIVIRLTRAAEQPTYPAQGASHAP